MRALIMLALATALAATAAAQDLGAQAPPKSPASYPENVPDPLLQAGDTIATATVIPALPYYDTGTTSGYTDNYDAVCPYTGSTAPDVVYRYLSPANVILNVDLCGSQYDTKLYAYDAALNVIACNDDFYTTPGCGIYVSRLENVTLQAGGTYYFVVDGYGYASGTYVFQIVGCGKCDCELECPAGGHPESEPPLVDDYVDTYNGGCDSPGDPLQSLSGDANGELTLCGVSGWYLNQGSRSRDTDWYVLTKGPNTSIEITADAEYATYLWEVGPQDCDAVGVVQQITTGSCAEAAATISGYAHGAPVWICVAPTVYAPPAGGANEYDYVVRLTGLEAAVAVESTTWGTVKALYN